MLTDWPFFFFLRYHTKSPSLHQVCFGFQENFDSEDKGNYASKSDDAPLGKGG